MSGFRFLAIACVALGLLTPAAVRADAPMQQSRVIRIATARSLPAAAAQATQRAKLDQVVALLKAKKTIEANAQWKAFAEAYFTRDTQGDLDRLLDWVLLKSHVESQRDLLKTARSAAYQERRRVAVQEHLADLRSKQRTLKGGTVIVRSLLLRSKTETEAEPVVENGRTTVNAAQLQGMVGQWEQKLATVGDDAQLANVDLQNALQKQQQLLQMLSNVSKLLHDTAMATIRKIGG
jgi:hypothetical protein